MGVNWKKIYREVIDCKNDKELDSFLESCDIEKGKVFEYKLKSLKGYGRDRKYRDKRSYSMKELRKEIEELESKLKSK